MKLFLKEKDTPSNSAEKNKIDNQVHDEEFLKEKSGVF